MEVDEKMEESCRLCDETSEQMFSIFEKNEDGIQILHLIKECIPIIIYRTDPLSKQICDSCFNNINMLYKFKKTAQETSERQKEKLEATVNNLTTDLATTVKLYLACGTEVEEGSYLKDIATSTDDLIIYCNSCKQAILDASTVNGELELCTDLHKAIKESMAKNKVTTESVSEKLLRRRKVVPFYHELDDSLCSSLTEYTHNTEGSQCFDEPSDMESIDSDETQARPRKRRRIESDDENDNDNDNDNEQDNDNDNENDNDNDNSTDNKTLLEKENDIECEPIVEINFEELFLEEEEYRYQPLSLLQLTLNLLNRNNVPEYEPEEFQIERIFPECGYCEKRFGNLKLLALHEYEHIDVEVGEKIDNPIPWPPSRDDADIRNRWLNYFDENGYEDEDIVIDTMETEEAVDGTEHDLLIPVDNKTGDTRTLTGNEKIELEGTQPMVNGVYLGDYTKEERKTFYQSMRIQGVNKKFCTLCRYTFKDNWAIESHYFSSACYYTCRYCGMRFNKQRHKFDEHVEEHKTKNDVFSEKIYAASKLSNVVPKIIHPPKERPKKIVVTQHNPPPEMKNMAQNGGGGGGGGGGQPQYHSIRVRNLMERRSLQANLMLQQQIKEEPLDLPKDVITSQSKTGNQAYFCRKCYKVFFKLDEFNIHSKNCDYNQFPQMRNFAKAMAAGGGGGGKNGEVSPTGRPMRNCAKDTGPYKDDVYLPESVMRESKGHQQQTAPQSFVCFICNTPFPTIYSRNSHMRIHKGEQPNAPSPIFRPRGGGGGGGPQQNNHQHNYRTPPLHHMAYNNPYNPDIVIKQEPMDMPPMEPMVEIHEPEQSETVFPETLGDGAVSITPISKNPKQKATINANVMKLVQNNPNLSIRRPAVEKQQQQQQSQMHHHQQQQQQHQQQQQQNHHNQMNFMQQQMMNPFPDPDKTYKCSSCWEAFANKSHLYFHKKNQCEGSRLPCPFCKKRFGTEAEYSSHIYYSHPE